jgi:hypothetical protein
MQNFLFYIQIDRERLLVNRIFSPLLSTLAGDRQNKEAHDKEATILCSQKWKSRNISLTTRATVLLVWRETDLTKLNVSPNSPTASFCHCQLTLPNMVQTNSNLSHSIILFTFMPSCLSLKQQSRGWHLRSSTPLTPKHFLHSSFEPHSVSNFFSS